MSYDEDHNDPRQHCKHGTFIGSWWGPDYLCHYCEMGYTDEEYQAEILARQKASLNEQLNRIIPAFFRDPENVKDIFPTWSPQFADWLVRSTLRHSDEITRIADELAKLGEDVYA